MQTKYILLILLIVFVGVWKVNAQNTAIYFDGVDDYISIPESNILLNTRTFTQECWLKYEADGNDFYLGVFEGIATDWTSSSPYLMIRRNGSLEFAYGSSPNGSYRSEVFLQPDIWFHIALTFDGTLYKVYIDGELKIEWNGAALAGEALPPATPINKIGVYNQHYFKGMIDEVRFWNTTRTETQINENIYRVSNPENESNLLAYYNFEIQSITDISSNNNSATHFGASFKEAGLRELNPSIQINNIEQKEKQPISEIELMPNVNGTVNLLIVEANTTFTTDEIVHHAELISQNCSASEPVNIEKQLLPNNYKLYAFVTDELGKQSELVTSQIFEIKFFTEIEELNILEITHNQLAINFGANSWGTINLHLTDSESNTTSAAIEYAVANEIYSFSVTNLHEATHYSLEIKFYDQEYEQWAESEFLSFETASAPVFPPQISEMSGISENCILTFNSTEFEFSANQSGDVFWMVTTDLQTQPTASFVVNQHNGELYPTANQFQKYFVSDLTDNTEYMIFTVIRSENGLLSDIYTFDFSTPKKIIMPEIAFTIQTTEIHEEQVSIGINSNTNGIVYWLISEVQLTEITVNQIEASNNIYSYNILSGDATLNISNLQNNTSYFLYCVLNSTDGRYSDISEIDFNTLRTEIPTESGNIFFEIYPNPASDYIHLQINEPKQLFITITDISGKINLQENLYGNSRIDISNLKSGVYFIQVSNDALLIGITKLIIHR